MTSIPACSLGIPWGSGVGVWHFREELLTITGPVPHTGVWDANGSREHLDSRR